MSKVIPFIFVEHAKEAIDVYKNAFNGFVEGPISDLGEQTGNPAFDGKVAHASLSISDSTIFIGEKTDTQKTHYAFLAVECEKAEEVIHAYDILSEGADIHMPIDEKTYAFSLVDRFGVSFLVYQK